MVITFKQFCESRPLYDPEPEEVVNLSGWLKPDCELITLADWAVTHTKWMWENVIPPLTDKEIAKYGDMDKDSFAMEWAYRHGYVRVVHDDLNSIYYHPRPTITQMRELKDLAKENGATLEYDPEH